jgi:hypothetical protein
MLLMQMKKFLAILLLSSPFPVFACYAPPAQQLVPPDELIARTQNIVLARAIRGEAKEDDYEVSYTFRTIKILKGSALDTFEIMGRPAIFEGWNENFDHHFHKDFWSVSAGRLSNEPDCRIHPVFSVGGTYLMFLDQPYHRKSFEIILRPEGEADIRDKWLQYVESRVKHWSSP